MLRIDMENYVLQTNMAAFTRNKTWDQTTIENITKKMYKYNVQ